jgi:hypothetical protein
MTQITAGSSFRAGPFGAVVESRRIDQKGSPSVARISDVGIRDSVLSKNSVQQFTALASYFVDTIQNLCTLRTLATMIRIMAAMPQLPTGESNKQRKKTLVGSIGWCRPLEFLESTPHAELKECISLPYKDAGR